MPSFLKYWSLNYKLNQPYKILDYCPYSDLPVLSEKESRLDEVSLYQFSNLTLATL